MSGRDAVENPNIHKCNVIELPCINILATRFITNDAIPHITITHGIFYNGKRVIY